MEHYTMAEVAKEILSKEEKMEFEIVFNKTKEILFSNWRLEASNDISDEKLIDIKRGELYKLFTIDGRFFRNEDGSWTINRPEDNN
ncbi:DNA-directed RNA polymerase subunit delta [Metamycoplasma buccale]|uniref:DNA-directed RNA polymerase subunit delta n=1 Tax=Metamycoplasma buccale TaxID=55602 RepID=UPI00398F28B7